MASSGVRRVAAAVVGLVVIALVAAVVVLTVQLVDERRDQRRDEEAADSARDAATGYAIDLMSYDYRTIDADLEGALSHTTGGFRETLETRGKENYDRFAELESVSQAEVTEAAVQEADEEDATVLLFVDQTINNKETKGPETDHARVVMTLVRDDDEWLVSDLRLT